MYSGKLKRDLTALVNSLENNAILLTDWDLLYPCYYVAHVEEERLGMMFIQAYPALDQRALAESAREFLRQNLPDRPVYALEPIPELTDEAVFEPTVRGGWTVFRIHPRENAESR
jgi:hypothetical protein